MRHGNWTSVHWTLKTDRPNSLGPHKFVTANGCSLRDTRKHQRYPQGGLEISTAFRLETVHSDRNFWASVLAKSGCRNSGASRLKFEQTAVKPAHRAATMAQARPKRCNIGPEDIDQDRDAVAAMLANEKGF